MLGNPSSLATKYNNLFGIKGQGTAGSVNMLTKEFVDNRMQQMPQRFAKNQSLEDSFTQHKNLMEHERYKNVLGAKSFEDAAREVSRAGYATDPHYSRSLLSVYNNYLKDRF